MKRKIFYPFINGNAGDSVYINRLTKSLNPKIFDYSIKNYSYFDIYIKNLKQSNINDFDLIHTIDETGDNFYKKNKPFVVTCLHSPFDNYYYKYCSIKQKLFYKFFLYNAMRKSFVKANKIIAISEYTKKSIQKTFGPLDIQVIYNGIDTDKYKPKRNESHKGKIRLLFVGNLIKRKGADLLPRIIEKLNDRFELYYTSGLRTKNQFNQKRMYPLGKLSEAKLIEEYQKCHIFLFPSRLEGFGYSVAEAMACGKPVITTNCSSLPELIINKKGGFLCERDNINDFVNKIQFLSLNKYVTNKMGLFNRKRIMQKFNIKNMEKKYEKLYDGLLAS